MRSPVGAVQALSSNSIALLFPAATGPMIVSKLKGAKVSIVGGGLDKALY